MYKKEENGFCFNYTEGKLISGTGLKEERGHLLVDGLRTFLHFLYVFFSLLHVHIFL